MCPSSGLKSSSYIAIRASQPGDCRGSCAWHASVVECHSLDHFHRLRVMRRSGSSTDTHGMSIGQSERIIRAWYTSVCCQRILLAYAVCVLSLCTYGHRIPVAEYTRGCCVHGIAHRLLISSYPFYWTSVCQVTYLAIKIRDSSVTPLRSRVPASLHNSSVSWP